MAYPRRRKLSCNLEQLPILQVQSDGSPVSSVETLSLPPSRKTSENLTVPGPGPAYYSRKRHSIASIEPPRLSPGMLLNLAQESDEEDLRMPGGSSCASSVIGSERRRRSSISFGDSGFSHSVDLQRLVDELKVKQTIEFEHDWTMLVTPQNGTVWVNYKRKLYRQYPPNYVVRRQQEDLRKGEQERIRMSGRIAELEASLAATKERIKKCEIMEEEYGEIQLKYEETEAQLKRSNKSLEKSKEDCKKLEEKNQQHENEIANLQIRLSRMAERVSELDEKEEKIELLTENLDKTRSSIREKEFEVNQARRRCDQAEKDIETLKEKIDDLLLKNDDLKYQVRVEIDRNSRMAQGLDEMEQMRETTARTLKEMEAINAELSDKTKLLSSARRCIREYRDKTRDYETYRDEVTKLKEELQVTQYENHTLKRMMVGKDSLVVQKTQALDLARQLIEHLKCKDEKVAGEVERLLEQANFVPTFPMGSNKSEKFADQASVIESSIIGSSHGDLSDGRSGVSNVSRSSSMRSTLRPSSVSTRDLLDIRSAPYSRAGSEFTLSQGSGSISSVPSNPPRPTTNGHIPGPRQHSWRPQTAVVKPQQRAGDAGSDGEGGGSKMTRKKEMGIAKAEMERIASLFVHLGDRVQLHLNKDEECHLATVKYIGQLDRGPQEKRVYVGVKMDSNIGNCDGTYNGVRYFNVPHNRGKIVRVSAIHSILNIKTDQFRTLEDCLREYSKHRRQ